MLAVMETRLPTVTRIPVAIGLAISCFVLDTIEGPR
jgi:hypothetical protein